MMILGRSGDRGNVGTWVAIAAIAALIGCAVPFFVGVMGDSAVKLAALPAAIVFVICLAFSRTWLLLFVVLLRGSTEVLFDASRFSIGPAEIGVGGLINGFAILILLLLVVEEPRRLSRVLVEAWFPFLAVLVLGIVITPNTGEALRLFLQLLSNFAVAAAAFYFVRDRKQFRACLWLVVWSAVVPAIYGFVELATGGGHEYVEGLRIRSTFSHPNVFAFYLVLVIGVAFYLLKTDERLDTLKKVALSLFVFVLFSLLLLTKTRSSWVACAVLFAGYALLFERRYFVYLLFAGVAALFMPGVGDRLLDVTQGTGAMSSSDQLNSFAWRQSIWESGLGWMTPGHYLLGYGLEAFRYLAPVFFREGGGRNWGAHNIFVQLFFEGGAVGVAAFLWMWARVGRAIRTMASFDPLAAFTIAFVMVDYLVTGASDNMLHYLSFNWYVWFVVGAGVAYAASDRARLPAKTPA